MRNSCTIIFKLSIVFVLASCSAILGPELRRSDTLVAESLNTLVLIQNREDLSSFRATAKDAAAIAIFPKVFKAGFFLGAEGGNGIVMARDTTGAWGYPAFYTLVGGSWGLQAGGQQAAVVFVIRSRKALKALLNHQGKVGADIGIALGPIGTGLEGATTSNLAADIVVFSDAKGLYGGISLEGSAIVRRNDLNEEYYGTKFHPEAVLLRHQHQNPQSDQIRGFLSRITGE